MPYRRRYKKKRTYKKKKYVPKKKPYKVSVPSGMPRLGRAKLTYVENGLLSATSGSLASQIWRAGSCFDPRHATGGHQPMGWDQWTALFNHYCVVGSKIEATFSPTTDVPMVCGVYLSADASAPYTTWTNYIEAKKGTYRVITDSDKTVKTSGKYSAKKFFNLSDVKDNISRIGARIDSNPVDDAYFLTWCQAQDVSSSVTANMLIKIQYIVDFGEPKNLPES